MAHLLLILLPEPHCFFRKKGLFFSEEIMMRAGLFANTPATIHLQKNAPYFKEIMQHGSQASSRSTKGIVIASEKMLIFFSRNNEARWLHPKQCSPP